MGKHIGEIGLQFREKFDYTGKMSREAMGKELWNEYYKMLMKERFASPEHKNEVPRASPTRPPPIIIAYTKIAS